MDWIPQTPNLQIHQVRHNLAIVPFKFYTDQTLSELSTVKGQGQAEMTWISVSWSLPLTTRWQVCTRMRTCFPHNLRTSPLVSKLGNPDKWVENCQRTGVINCWLRTSGGAEGLPSAESISAGHDRSWGAVLRRLQTKAVQAVPQNSLTNSSLASLLKLWFMLVKKCRIPGRLNQNLLV